MRFRKPSNIRMEFLIALCLTAPPLMAQSAQNQSELAALSDILGIDVSKTLCLTQTKSQSDISRQQIARFTKRPSSPVNAQPAAENTTETVQPEMMDHSHIPIAVPETAAKPELSLTLTEDVMSGYNLKLTTRNYDLTPPPSDIQSMEALMLPTVNKKTGFVQGHAHLYVNEKKIQRVYGENVHLPASLFKNGINQLNITINNHAHMYWTVDSKQVLSTVFLNTLLDKKVVYQFDSFPVQ